MIVSRHGVKKDVEVFKKYCSTCQLDYWSNDPTSGLFNFNNHLFLTTDLMLWLKNGLHEHMAISNHVALLQRTYKVFIEKDKILKAFFKFESLVDCNNDYKCILCGIYPVILNFDVMRKCAFKLHGTLDNTNRDLDEKIDHGG